MKNTKKKSFKKTLKKNNNKSSIKKTSKKYYYIVKSKYLDNDFVRKTMKKRKIWEKYDFNNPQTDKIDFSYIGSYYYRNKNYWSLKSKINGIIDYSGKNIIKINKFNILQNLIKLNDPKLNSMILKQHFVNLYSIYKKKVNLDKYKNLFKNNKVWIFKFIYGSQGRDIVVLNSYEKFKKFVFKTINANKSKWKNFNKFKYEDKVSLKEIYFIEWVLQEYITNPLLYEDKKFHFRGFFIYSYDSIKNKKEGFYLDNQHIITAKLPFKKSDYLNKDIHDSHGNSTPYEINYKPDLTKLLNQRQIRSIDNQIKYLYKSLLKILNLKCYQNDDYCFNLFGSDIMITDDYQIKFIELNERPGLADYKDNFKKINSNILFNKILKNIVDKQYPPLTDNIKKTKKTKKSKNTKSNEPKLIKL